MPCARGQQVKSVGLGCWVAKRPLGDVWGQGEITQSDDIEIVRRPENKRRRLISQFVVKDVGTRCHLCGQVGARKTTSPVTQLDIERTVWREPHFCVAFFSALVN